MVMWPVRGSIVGMCLKGTAFQGRFNTVHWNQDSPADPQHTDSLLSDAVVDRPHAHAESLGGLCFRERYGVIHFRVFGGRRYEWRVQRKAELEEEERERKRQAERAERERQKGLEQARIDRLLKSAAAFQQAGAIRKYVEAIRATQTDNAACPGEELKRWCQWALSEAERIDPAVEGKFLLTMRDE